jgi:excisionase family DNA binding protein
MKPMARDLDILTVREVGHLLRVRPDTVYRLVRQRKIPSFRIGPYWRFRRDLIEHWMAQKSMYARQIRKVIGQARMEKFDIGHWAAPAGP